MQRRILSIHRDEIGASVADLACGHAQSIPADSQLGLGAHDGGLAEEGRAARGQQMLDCAGCDRRTIPTGFAPHRRTTTFREGTVPKGLLSRHTTKAGVWAQIHVVRGRLEYRIHGPFDTVEILDPSDCGIVLPEVEHQVTPLGAVEFFVEFWRSQAPRE